MALNVKFLKGTAAAYNALVTAATVEKNTFYYTEDDNMLYLGSIKLSNGVDLAAAIQDITKTQTEVSELKTKLNELLGITEDGEPSEETKSIADMIKEAVDKIEAKIGDMSTLETTDKTTLVKAINEVRNSVSAGGTAAAITIDTTTTTEGAAKSYTIKQGDNTVGTIDIPKDMVVSSAEVRTLADDEITAERPQGTYIILTIANATADKLYVNAGTLVDIYRAKADATQVQVAIDQAKNEISATIVAGSIGTTELADNAVTTIKIADGNITTDKILDGAVTENKVAANAITTTKIKDGAVTEDKIAADAVTTTKIKDGAVTEDKVATDAISSDKIKDGAITSDKIAADAITSDKIADGAITKEMLSTELLTIVTDGGNAVKDIESGATNGTIKVVMDPDDAENGSKEVAVKGLGSAAYTEANAYDVAGSAATAEANAKTYVDKALTWGTL